VLRLPLEPREHDASAVEREGMRDQVVPGLGLGDERLEVSRADHLAAVALFERVQDVADELAELLA
jgi:hypothetical protein